MAFEIESEVLLNLVAVFVCITFAALMAGLTMGLLSLDPLDLLIKIRTSDPATSAQAQAVLPIVTNHHRLLVTLLLINAGANEALPLFLDELVPSYMAIILSVTLVLFCGEIIPSAIFTGPNQLRIAAKLAPLTRLLMFTTAPISYPIAKVLDKMLGHAESSNYSRREIMALVQIQYENSELNAISNANANANANINEETKLIQSTAKSKSNKLNSEEVSLVKGALSLTTLTAFDAMIKVSKIFSVSSDAILNDHLLAEIFYRGHSRILVTAAEAPDKFVGYILTRQLILISASDFRRVGDLPLRELIVASPTMNLADLLNVFQEGPVGVRGGHLAIVADSTGRAVGMITLEDIIEEILQEEIMDESDRIEMIAVTRAKRVAKKWRQYSTKKRLERNEEDMMRKNLI